MAPEQATGTANIAAGHRHLRPGLHLPRVPDRPARLRGRAGAGHPGAHPVRQPRAGARAAPGGPAGLGGPAGPHAQQAGRRAARRRPGAAAGDPRLARASAAGGGGASGRQRPAASRLRRPGAGLGGAGHLPGGGGRRRLAGGTARGRRGLRGRAGGHGRFHCPIDRLRDGSVLATILPPHSATDQARIAARCALALRELWPGARSSPSPPGRRPATAAPASATPWIAPPAWSTTERARAREASASTP